MDLGNVLKKAVRSGSVYFYLALVFAGLGLAVYGFLTAADLPSWGYYDDARNEFYLYAFIGLAAAAFSGFVTYNRVKQFICVCERGISGVAPKGLLSQSFEVLYYDINNVSAAANTLIIDCKNARYNLSIKDAKEVCEMIENRISK